MLVDVRGMLSETSVITTDNDSNIVREYPTLSPLYITMITIMIIIIIIHLMKSTYLE